MSRGINKVILVGYLGAPPDVRYSNTGQAIVRLSVATSDSWQDKNTGEKRERTEWHRVMVFGKVAEIAAEYLNKGSQVYLEGQLQTRKWQGQNGDDRFTTEVVIQGWHGVLQRVGDRVERPPNPHESWRETQSPKYELPTNNEPNNSDIHRTLPHPLDTTPPEFGDDDIPF